MMGHRYATALIPLIVLLAILPTRTLLSDFFSHAQHKFSVILLVIPLILAPVHFLGYYSRDFHKGYKCHSMQDYRAIIEYLIKKNLGNTSLVIREPGIPGYFFPGKIIDIWGLTDRTIARIKQKHKIPITSIKFGLDAVAEYRGNAMKEIADYVFSRHPTAIYYHGDYFIYKALGDERLKKLGYRKIEIENVPHPLLVNFQKDSEKRHYVKKYIFSYDTGLEIGAKEK